MFKQIYEGVVQAITFCSISGLGILGLVVFGVAVYSMLELGYKVVNKLFF